MNDNASPLAEEANAYYEGLLRSIFAGRKFLIAGQVAAAESLSGLARQLTGLGAARPFLIAGSEGTGPLPTPHEAELRVLGIQSTDVLDDFRKLRRTDRGPAPRPASRHRRVGSCMHRALHFCEPLGGRSQCG